MKYRRFFTGDRVHNRLMVGLDSRTSGCVSLAEVFRKHALPSDRVFLKIDIEGSEYGTLKDLLANASQISGLVIEFHDFDLNQQAVKNFVQKFPLKVAHVHCNNYGGKSARGVPKVIELTFSSHEPISPVVPSFPHAFDSPNSPRRPEIEINFDES